MGNNRRASVVTGGAVGIGRQIVETLARRGDSVLATWFEHEPPDDLGVIDGEVQYVRADLTDEKDAAKLAEVCGESLGAIDAIVCNAGGLLARREFGALETELWERVVRVNLTSAFLTLKALVPLLKEGGRVVLMGSLAGETGGGPGSIAYAAAKAGLVGLCRGLAKELGPRGVTVNVVAPGYIGGTNFHSTFTSPSVREELEKRLPVRRVGAPEDVASLVRYLTDVGSGYFTGQTCVISGGEELV